MLTKLRNDSRNFDIPNTSAKKNTRSFGFDYFTFVMGTGIVAVLAPRISAIFSGPAKLLWLANALALILFSIIAIYKYGFSPARFLEVMRDETKSHFFGAVPMAYASVTNGVMVFYPYLFGSHTITVLEFVVVLDCLLSLFTATVVAYHLFTNHEVGLHDMTATWLLPIVPAEVAAASDAFLIPHLPHAAGDAFLWLGYLMWGISVPLALTILSILFLRLALHKLPGKNLATNSWLTLGPLGTGAAGILALGSDAHLVLPANLAALDTPLLALGIVGAFALFGYGVWWWLTSIGVSLRFLFAGQYPFNYGWWAFTFPLGVLTTAAYELAGATQLGTLGFLAHVMTAILIGLWILVATRTVHSLTR